jgi:hypothetical protein
VPLNHSTAQFSITRPSAGTHSVTVVFAQQGNYAAASSRTQQFIVLPAPVRVALAASTRSAKVGVSIALQAAVTSSSGAGTPNATGSVTFRDGLTVLAVAPVDANGQAAFSTSSLSAGVHIISATYANGTNYGAGLDSLIIVITR